MGVIAVEERFTSSDQRRSAAHLVPELRAGALCGPSIEAVFVAHAMDRITNARSLSRDIGVSYAAAHAAVQRLVGRGLLLRHRNGVQQELSLSAFAVNALKVEG
jgi:hypothetical protein